MVNTRLEKAYLLAIDVNANDQAKKEIELKNLRLENKINNLNNFYNQTKERVYKRNIIEKSNKLARSEIINNKLSAISTLCEHGTSEFEKLTPLQNDALQSKYEISKACSALLSLSSGNTNNEQNNIIESDIFEIPETKTLIKKSIDNTLPFWDRGLEPEKRLDKKERNKIGLTFRKWTMQKNRLNAKHFAHKFKSLNTIPSYLLEPPAHIVNTSLYKELNAKNMEQKENKNPGRTFSNLPLHVTPAKALVDKENNTARHASILKVHKDEKTEIFSPIKKETPIKKEEISPVSSVKGSILSATSALSSMKTSPKTEVTLVENDANAVIVLARELTPNKKVSSYNLDLDFKELSAKFSIEKQRVSGAKRLRLIERLKYLKMELPPLCPCGTTIFEATPIKCANNCHFYQNQKGFNTCIDNLYYEISRIQKQK